MSKKRTERLTIIALILLVALVAVPAISMYLGGRAYDERTKGKRILNNLRMIATYADQHFLTTESEKIEVNEMIALGYFDPLENYDGEDYSTILVEKDFKSISVSTSDSTIYTYEPN